MKTINNIKQVYTIIILSFALFCLPQSLMAQRFGHGGGGMRGGGGGGVRVGGGGGRSFNGGAVNVGAHVFNRGGGARNDGGGFRGVRNENVYHHASGFRPYSYHPYHPYIWGPRWHPFGFFAYSLAADAILLSIADQQYYYADGVYYQPYNGGYSVVAPPIGAVVSYVPAGYQVIQMQDGSEYYYYGGAFYIPQGGSFRVVPAPVGAVVNEIPEGATDQQISGQDYLLYNNTYFQPISQNGQDAYEVVQVN